MKIELINFNENRHLNIRFETKDAFITCKIMVYGVIEGTHFECNDIELDFYLLDKIVNRKAFKELYENLFGKDSYEIYCNKLYEFAEQSAHEEFVNGTFK